MHKSKSFRDYIIDLFLYDDTLQGDEIPHTQKIDIDKIEVHSMTFGVLGNVDCITLSIPVTYPDTKKPLKADVRLVLSGHKIVLRKYDAVNYDNE